MFPAIVLVQTEVDLDERTPLGPLGFADETKPRLLRCAIGLEGVAFDARAHDVLPSRRPAAVAREHVVQVEVFALKNVAAILAGVLVALKNIGEKKPCGWIRYEVPLGTSRAIR